MKLLQNILATNKRFFMIVSGNRCGSTLLECMLGELSDVSVDFEFQWTDKVHTPAHVSLMQQTDIKDFLRKSLPKNRILGSKLVVPPVHTITDKNIADLNRIFKNIFVIHIGRNYFDSFLSKYRGSGHVKSEHYNQDGKRIEDWLKDEYVDNVFNKEQSINKDLVYKDLTIRMANDKNLIESCRGAKNFMHVEYSEILANFSKISKFINSKDSNENIQRITLNPPLKKINKLDYTKLITNYAELSELSAEFEEKRHSLI